MQRHRRSRALCFPPFLPLPSLHAAWTTRPTKRNKPAHTLVAAALAGYEHVFLPDELEEIRDYLVDELV